MQELYNLLMGIALLILGIPIGNMLAKVTKEELRQGKKYFKMLVIMSSIGTIIFLILGNDALLFGLLFIAVVTSRSLKK